jgi:hypothetical protein
MRWGAAVLLLAGCESWLGEKSHLCTPTSPGEVPYYCPGEYACADPPLYCGVPDPNVDACKDHAEHDPCTTTDPADGVCVTTSGARTCTACTPEIAWCPYAGWQPMHLPPDMQGVDLWSVYVVEKGEAYAGGLGSTGGVLFRYDGLKWSQVTDVPILANKISSIWGSGRDNVFVAAATDVYHYDGAAWTPTPTDGNKALLAVWGAGPDDVFGVGATIQEYRAATGWREIAAPIQTLKAVWATNDSGTSKLVAVGSSGPTIGYHDTCAASTCSGVTGDSEGLYGVWGSSATNVFIVGAATIGATILIYNGTSVSPVAFPPGFSKPDLNGIWGASATQVYAVGQGGTILYYDGASWSEWPVATKPIGATVLNAVSGVDNTNIMAVGTGGVIWRYSGL